MAPTLTGEVSGSADVTYTAGELAKADGTISMDFLWATESEAALSDFTRNGTELDGKDIKGNLLDSITTPLGKIIIHITPNYVKGDVYKRQTYNI